MTLFMSNHRFPHNQAQQNKQTRSAHWRIEFILLRTLGICTGEAKFSIVLALSSLISLESKIGTQCPDL